MGFIGWIIIGGLAGWAAEKFMKADHGIFTNIFIGILGGIVGGWLFGLLDLQLGSGWIGSFITAAVGACIIIWIYRAIRNKEQGQPVDPIMPRGRDNSDENVGENTMISLHEFFHSPTG